MKDELDLEDAEWARSVWYAQIAEAQNRVSEWMRREVRNAWQAGYEQAVEDRVVAMDAKAAVDAIEAAD